jgi:glutamine synthetase
MATKTIHPRIVAAVQKSGATKVKVAVSDIDGILRGKYLHIDKFWARPSATRRRLRLLRRGAGLGRARRLLRQHQVTGWQHGFPDALARLDLDTARACPGTATCRSSWASSSTPTARPSRPARARRLKRVLASAPQAGLQAMTGMEFEWFNFAETPQSWAAKKGVGPET